MYISPGHLDGVCVNKPSFVNKSENKVSQSLYAGHRAPSCNLLILLLALLLQNIQVKGQLDLQFKKWFSPIQNEGDEKALHTSFSPVALTNILIVVKFSGF